MRVLHVAASLAPRYGGPSAVLPKMCAALARRGHEVEIFTTTRDGPQEMPATVGEGTSIDGVPVTYFRSNPPRAFSTSWTLRSALKSRVGEVDVVHIHSLYRFHTEVSSHYARRTGTPYLIRPHGTLNVYDRSHHRLPKWAYHRLIEDRTLRAAAGLHVTSESEREHVERLGLGPPALLVPLGVDAPIPSTEADWEELVERHPELAGRPLVTCVARLSAVKSLDLLIQAFAAARGADTEAQLVLAGPDDEGLGTKLRSLARAEGLGDRVTLTGMLLGPPKDALLQRSSVFALPSKDENFGVAVMEAAGAGVPVIVTPGVGVHPHIQRAGAGWVVPRKTENIAAALREALLDPDGARARGEAGRRLVQECYSWDRVAVALEDVYVGLT